MSASFLAAAAERAAAVPGSAIVPAPLTGGGLMDAPGFWQKEQGAPLLRRNSGYLTPEGIPDDLRQRLGTWPALCGASNAAVAEGVCDDEAAFRIFLRDAERTFQDEGHRQDFMDLLKRVWPENRDYHQGLGYVTSLLMLVFDTSTTLNMLLQLTRSPKYTPGYWRAAPEPYVRDAMVYARLVQEREPEVAALLQAACVVPEAYASKWFIGLCVPRAGGRRAALRSRSWNTAHRPAGCLQRAQARCTHPGAPPPQPGRSLWPRGPAPAPPSTDLEFTSPPAPPLPPLSPPALYRRRRRPRHPSRQPRPTTARAAAPPFPPPNHSAATGARASVPRAVRLCGRLPRRGARPLDGKCRPPRLTAAPRRPAGGAEGSGCSYAPPEHPGSSPSPQEPASERPNDDEDATLRPPQVRLPLQVRARGGGRDQGAAAHLPPDRRQHDPRGGARAESASLRLRLPRRLRPRPAPLRAPPRARAAPPDPRARPQQQLGGSRRPQQLASDRAGAEAFPLSRDQVLRLDITQYPDDYEGGAFFVDIVRAAHAVELEQAHVDRLREEEGVILAEKQRKAREREAELAAESDDEIVFSDEEDD